MNDTTARDFPNLEHIKPFTDISIDAVEQFGGKNASLGEMSRNLIARGIRIPPGFAISADGYRYFLEHNQLDEPIRELLADLNPENIPQLRKRGRAIREAILESELPTDLRDEIGRAYEALRDDRKTPLEVAIRSSATAEDLPESSFAGQQESFLNIRGIAEVAKATKRCFASLFTDRAISYRAERGFDHLEIALSVGIQKMVRSDLAASGVAFSIDTETGFDNVVLINAAYGLGESVVKGEVNPDEYLVFKGTLGNQFRPILKKSLGSKEKKLVYGELGDEVTQYVNVPAGDRRQCALDDDHILQLAEWVQIIEQYYSEKNGRPTPMDVEWAVDGLTDELYILQARPETVHSRRSTEMLETYHLHEHSRTLVTGHAIGSEIADGRVQVIHHPREIEKFREGAILVTSSTDPDWEPIMKKAAAIVTNRGGRTSHAAIVSRELGLPAIVGAQDATHALHSGKMVTVSCAEGDEGVVYEGKLRYSIDRTDLSDLPRPETDIMMNIANPSQAFQLGQIPNDGVGLAREEFIIASHVGVHPLALTRFDTLEDPELRRQIQARTSNYDNKADYFVDKLAEGIGTIGAAYHPNDVIVRLSDFKTNEYANLLGGEPFEPREQNPMLGFRGASRYYHDDYREAFLLECKALKHVRDVMGLRNVQIMVPFCRTIEEAHKVQDILAEQGLERGQNGLELYVMCEVPSNVVMAPELSELFDGFSIGSNDLTQLVLGVDRDSEILADLFDERNEAVKRLIRQVIRTAHENDCKVGICGQAPSDYPEFAAFLVSEGIDSMSLNPDAVLRTTKQVLELEQS